MKYFRDRTLAFQISFFLASLILLFVIQFVVLQAKISALEQLHFQRDFARQTQVSGQQVFVNATLFLQGRDDLIEQIVSAIDQQEHAMKTLADGGRIAGTAVFIEQLPDLPRISFRELQGHWQTFRQIVQRTSLNEPRSGNAKDLMMARAQWLSISSWFDRLIEDMDKVIISERSSLDLWVGIVAFVNVGLCVAGYPVFKRKIALPLKKMERNTADYTHTLDLPPDEIGAVASRVNDVIEQLKDASDFVKEIGEGNLSVRYEDLDKGYQHGKNRLADSLIDMQVKLRQLNEEDQRRQWINEGLTKFVDILRSGGHDLGTLGDSIISTLASYTGSAQGSLYLLNDSNPQDPYLELISLFAFDIRKFESRHIKIGEGILGQTFLEKESTYLKNIPQQYIRITSGLGGANPTSLLVVPLKIDQDVFGVIELASFNEYREHEISFVERLGETIASTFAAVKAAGRNRELLEEARNATEMMRSQEEEMRQNMEELQATQEEMARKEKDYIIKIEGLERKLAYQGNSKEEEALKAELAGLRREKEACAEALQEERNKKPSAGDEWRIAEEVERALRINLEAIKAMQEEFGRPPGP
jgi:hypothetical protein